MKNPVQAFFDWFVILPLIQRQMLAHMFQVSTTEDVTLVVSGLDVSLERFCLWASRQDFPLRVAARMFYIRSVFDLVVFHHREILLDKGLGRSFPDQVVELSDYQWEALVSSWQELRSKELSDAYVHAWASYAIRVSAEES